MTARDVWVIPAAAVVAGTVVGVGLSLAAFESVMRTVARVTGRRAW